MKIFTIEKKERRNVIRLFGHTIFRFGEKRRGLYDIKRIIENYANVKTNIKKWEVQHGWTPFENASRHDLQKDIKLYLTWSKRLKEDWEKNSNVQCEIITAPFVLYRRQNNIKQKPDAKGTVAFPAHSTIYSRAIYDIDEYCNLLKSLPDEFQPVTICLHHSDIEEYEMDKEFEKRGFKTVCASFNQGDKQFYEAFYDILCSHKYATSNEPGSYTFYAAEAGIPFFIAGKPSITDNFGLKDPDLNVPKYSILDSKYGKMAYDLFKDKDFEIITEEQKQFVEEELGINDGISPEELKSLFIKHNLIK